MIASYDPILVFASVLVAVMASFTGLKLLAGLRHVDASRKKLQLGKAAVALGGGIWSMHFIAMLAVSLPVPIVYDALLTLGSVLIAILITGLGLSLMHVGERTSGKTALAGTLIGLGITSMHYVGMQAIKGNCVAQYAPPGFIVPVAIAILFSICALHLAYRNRTLGQLALGSVLLGVTISGMHYSAMAFTSFVRVEAQFPVLKPMLPDTYLALIVAVAAFLVCGVFLLTALPMAGPDKAAGDADVADATAAGPAAGEVASLVAEADADRPATPAPAANDEGERVRVPYEQNNRVYFLDAARIRAIKAEGHYTRILDGEDSLFCPWSISRLEEHLDGLPFMRTHRSFLLNIAHAEAFQRQRDKAYVIVSGPAETAVPVSRSHLGDVRRSLGM